MRDVADLLETEVHRVALPDLDAGPQDGVQRAGHVEVAHTAAGQPGRPGARTLLVDQDDVGALPLAGALQQHRQVIGGGHAVDSGADHDVLAPPSGSGTAPVTGMTAGFWTTPSTSGGSGRSRNGYHWLCSLGLGARSSGSDEPAGSLMSGQYTGSRFRFCRNDTKRTRLCQQLTLPQVVRANLVQLRIVLRS